MSIVPVVDIKDGRVVHAVAGKRDGYQPIRSKLVDGCDPCTIARALIDHCKASALYVADLDSLVSGTAPAIELVDQLDTGNGASPEVWFDAAWHTHRASLSGMLAANLRPVVSLESIPDLHSLPELLQLTSESRPIFSLDLNDGTPVSRSDDLRDMNPLDLIDSIAELGFRSLIVLDIARVGTGGGAKAADFLAEIKPRHPKVELISGGGVDSRDDVQTFLAAGCDHVLVATALHQGRF